MDGHDVETILHRHRKEQILVDIHRSIGYRNEYLVEYVLNCGSLRFGFPLLENQVDLTVLN